MYVCTVSKTYTVSGEIELRARNRTKIIDAFE